MEADLRPEELERWSERLNRGFGEWSSAQTVGKSVVDTTSSGFSQYRTDELWEEIAYLGYHLHWELDTLMGLEHADRRRLVAKVAALNERAWKEAAGRG